MQEFAKLAYLLLFEIIKFSASRGRTLDLSQVIKPLDSDIFAARGRLPQGFYAANVGLVWTVRRQEDGGVADADLVVLALNGLVVDTAFGPLLAFVTPFPNLIFGQK